MASTERHFSTTNYAVLSRVAHTHLDEAIASLAVPVERFQDMITIRECDADAVAAHFEQHAKAFAERMADADAHRAALVDEIADSL